MSCERLPIPTRRVAQEHIEAQIEQWKAASADPHRSPAGLKGQADIVFAYLDN